MKYSGRIRWIGTILFLFPALAMARPDWFRELFRNQPAQKEPKAAAVVIRYDANVLCLGSYCNLEMDHSAYGPGTDLHYTWLLLSDGTVVGREKTLTFTPGMESVYGLCAVLEDMGKEVGRDTLQIYVTHVPEYQPVPDTVCYGMEATVGVEGGRYWAWSTGGTTQFVNVRPAETTTYYFRVSEYPIAEYGYENACYAEDSVHVAVLDSAVFTIEGPGGICQGVPVTLEVKGGSDILWNGVPGDARHSFVAERDTGIRVTATDRHGCRDTKEWQIELVDRPEGRIMAYVDGEDVDSVCLGKSVRLEVDSRQADRFRWFTRDTAVSIELEPKSAFLAWCDLFSGPSDQCSTRIQREILVRPNLRQIEGIEAELARLLLRHHLNTETPARELTPLNSLQQIAPRTIAVAGNHRRRLLIRQIANTLATLEVKLHPHTFPRRIDQREGMTAEPVHVAVPIRNTAITHHNRHRRPSCCCSCGFNQSYNSGNTCSLFGTPSLLRSDSRKHSDRHISLRSFLVFTACRSSHHACRNDSEFSGRPEKHESRMISGRMFPHYRESFAFRSSVNSLFRFAFNVREPVVCDEISTAGISVFPDDDIRFLRIDIAEAYNIKACDFKHA